MSFEEMLSTVDKSYKDLINAFLGNLTEIYNKIHETECFPKDKNILRALRIPVDKIKCVFVGMDPYHSWYLNDGIVVPVATGRSFEVGNVTDWLACYKQTSLKNIFKSLYFLESGFEYDVDELRIKAWQGNIEFLHQFPTPKDWFDAMETQGVVFLNASLSVEKGKPNSHMELWKEFIKGYTEFVLKQNPNIQWILAGDKAQKRFGEIIPEQNIIACNHPRIANFVSQCPFEKVDEISWLKNVK